MRTEQIEIDDLLVGESSRTEYDAFVEKFKPKLTTDDCYTPQRVYEAIADWVEKTYGVDRARFVRPFYPGGDYENYPYKAGDIVVDNPPFSIETKIVKTYCKRGIRFLLFCHGTTGLFKGIETIPCTIIATGAAIVYANGASVNTSFVTNLEAEYIVRSAPDLCKLVEAASREEEKKQKLNLPKYKYPPHVVTIAQVNYFSQHDTAYYVRRGEAVRIDAMDEQKQVGKKCFGGGLLVSEKAAAEKAAAEKATVIELRLSEREKKIVEQLGQRDLRDGGGRTCRQN